MWPQILVREERDHGDPGPDQGGELTIVHHPQELHTPRTERKRSGELPTLLLGCPQQLGGRPFERGGELQQVLVTDVALTRVHSRDVRAVELAAVRKRLLADAELRPTCPDRVPKGNVVR